MSNRLVIPLAIFALAAALLAGCGGSSDSGSTGSGTAPRAGTSTAPAGASARACETEASDAEALRATAVSCSEARQVMFAWQRADACGTPTGASRSACGIRSYRCLSAASGRGVAVSCARPGHSIAFIAKRG